MYRQSNVLSAPHIAAWSLALMVSMSCDGTQDTASGPDGLEDVSSSDERNEADSLDSDASVGDDSDTAAAFSAVVVTFNTGSSVSLRHGDGSDDGYSAAQAAITDEWYGNGLSWKPFVESTAQFFDELQPDIVAFQEIFHPGECPGIPEEARLGTVCEDWEPGHPTVAQRLLSQGWQVMCNPERPDKCLAVRNEFGRFEGCDDELCLEGMAGFGVDGCSSGVRIGRARIRLADGGRLTVINVHGTSGINSEDAACRAKQVDQVFADFGDGEPGANGERNLILGDFNTDPGRFVGSDESADRWRQYVGSGLPFHFHTEIGPDAEPTYAELFNIDHVVSDQFQGDCWAAGVSEGHPDVLEAVFFDHRPIVCTLTD